MSGLEEAALRTPLPRGCQPEWKVPRLAFLQGDAMDLPADLGAFDRVHAANLLCRLPEPQRLLERLPALVKPGGELVLATPCTWLEEFTPPENWPPGGTFDWLLETLDTRISTYLPGGGTVSHPRNRAQVPVDHLAGDRLAAPLRPQQRRPLGRA